MHFIYTGNLYIPEGCLGTEATKLSGYDCMSVSSPYTLQLHEFLKRRWLAARRIFDKVRINELRKLSREILKVVLNVPWARSSEG